jgi:hypothetical protein
MGRDMTISHENFIAELTYCRNEFAVVLSELKCIEKDSPATHHQLLDLNDRYVEAGNHLPAIIEFIANEKPGAAVVGDKLQKAFQLLTEILREKVRILENTPEVFKNTNDMTHLS